MENLTNSAEEVLIDRLSFKLPLSGQYVTDRRSCTFHTLKEATRIQHRLAPRSFAFVSLAMAHGSTRARFELCSMSLMLILTLLQRGFALSEKPMLSSQGSEPVFGGKS